MMIHSHTMQTEENMNADFFLVFYMCAFCLTFVAPNWVCSFSAHSHLKSICNEINDLLFFFAILNVYNFWTCVSIQYQVCIYSIHYQKWCEFMCSCVSIFSSAQFIYIMRFVKSRPTDLFVCSFFDSFDTHISTNMCPHKHTHTHIRLCGNVCEVLTTIYK